MDTGDLTSLLEAIKGGDATAADKLVPLVYDELRRLAGAHMRAERPGHTLQATALVHEVYARLVDQTRISWTGRTHFMAVAAELIRRILVDHARAAQALKRGGDRARVSLTGVNAEADTLRFDVLDLNEALAELGELSPRQSKVVELKFFGGLENGEIAGALGVSETIVKKEWRFARAWLAQRLGVPGRT